MRRWTRKVSLLELFHFFFLPFLLSFVSFRYNARGFDLNRNFPDYFKQNNRRSQPETEAVKEWVSKIQFVLSGSLHGGALVASYPFDNTPNSRKIFFLFNKLLLKINLQKQIIFSLC